MLLRLYIVVNLVFWIFCPNQRAFAQEDNLEKQRVYKSARFLGRGDTGIAAAENEDAIFYNPAGLALGKGIYRKSVLAAPMIEFSLATRDLARKLGAEKSEAVDAVRDNIGKPNHFGVNTFSGIVLRRAALGAFHSNSLDLVTYKSVDSAGLEVLEAGVVQNTGVTFSLAEQFWKGKLLLGATGKFIYRGKGDLSVAVTEAQTAKDQLEDTANFIGLGYGTGGDIGMMLRGGGRSNPSLGVTVENIGNTPVIPEEPTNVNLDLEQTVNVGVSVEPGTRFSKLKLLIDYRDVLSNVEANWRKKLFMGTELSVANTVGMTGGLYHGYPSLGLYFDLWLIDFDFGMYSAENTDRVGTRPDQRFYFRLNVEL